jgi:hypothetical protein
MARKKLTKKQTERIYIFVHGGCVDSVTDGQGNDLDPLGNVCVIDYDESDTENVCPICRQDYESEEDCPTCPNCGYRSRIGTIKEALRAAHIMENKTKKAQS